MSGNITTAGERSVIDIKTEYINNSKTIVISGTIPLNHKSSIKYMAAVNPAEFGATVLKETLLSKGIEVNGNIFCTRGGCSQIKDLKALSTNGGTALPDNICRLSLPKIV